MRPITPTELLTIWEQGINQTLMQKTLHLLSLACPYMDYNTIAKLNIGERDARLLQLREWMFGSRLNNMVDCPKCSERCEWETDIKDICLQSVQQHESIKELSLEVDKFSISFRLPNSGDIAAVIADKSGQSDPRKLLENCILKIQRNGENCEVNDMPDKVLRALNRRIEKEDPQADIRMIVNCPNCSHKWEAQFDIVSYFWTEINRWAKRILQDVYILARAFGWSEHEILNMNPVRRQLYLEMVNL